MGDVLMKSSADKTNLSKCESKKRKKNFGLPKTLNNIIVWAY